MIQSRREAASGREIDVDGLEAELSALWAELTEARSGEGAGVMRACVLNLILFAATQPERASLDELLDEVTAAHPCRAIVLLADRETADAERLSAYVSTRCRLSTRGAKQICGEQVTIEAGAAALERAASVVAPLLVPDVPVFLFWKELSPGVDALFERLSRMADRIVFDSAASQRPQADLLRLSQMIAARVGQLRASDLNWGRLTSWRSLLAHLWDVGEYRTHLDRVSRLRLEYNGDERAPAEISAQALLMAGWLASRLGWELESTARTETTTTLNMRAATRPLTVELMAVVPVDGCERRVSALTLVADETGAEFRLAWRPERTKLEMSIRLGGDERTLEHLLAYETRTDAERLSHELSLLARDASYEEALACAARFVLHLDGAAF